MKFSRLYIAAIVVFAVGKVSYGQAVVGGNQAKAMDMNTIPLGTISAFGFPEKVVTGSQLLFDTWRSGTIEVGPNVISSVPVNIDVKHNLIEINTTKGIRTVPVKSVTNLIVLDKDLLTRHRFVNAAKYNGSEVFATGLFEILVDSQTSLFKYNYVFEKEGNYNAALDMGNNETKFIIRSKYFLHANGKNTEIITNKKKFLALFNEKDKAEVESFTKEKNLSLKDEKDLITLCLFLNEKNYSLN